MDGSSSKKMKGSKVLVIGGSRGLGLAIVKALLADGYEVYATIRTDNIQQSGKELIDILDEQHMIKSVDLESDDVGDVVAKASEGIIYSYLYVVAGYFYTGETFENINLKEEKKMIQICGFAPLLITQRLVLSGSLAKGSNIIWITSEGGSIYLRDEPESGHYGHHASKCMANMNGRMLSLDLKPKGIPLVMVHPGFLKTEMTQHYKHLYQEFGAVEPEEAAPAIIQAGEKLDISTTGKFIAPLGRDSLGLGKYRLPETFKPFDEIPF